MIKGDKRLNFNYGGCILEIGAKGILCDASLQTTTNVKIHTLK